MSASPIQILPAHARQELVEKRELQKQKQLTSRQNRRFNELYQQLKSPWFFAVNSKKFAIETIFTLYFHHRHPSELFPLDKWIDLLAQVGFKSEQPDPDQPLTLYRGSVKDHPHGLSWTPYFDYALGYARAVPGGAVYRLDCSWPEIIAASHPLQDKDVVLEILIDSRKYTVTPIFDAQLEEWIS